MSCTDKYHKSVNFTNEALPCVFCLGCIQQLIKICCQIFPKGFFVLISKEKSFCQTICKHLFCNLLAMFGCAGRVEFFVWINSSLMANDLLLRKVSLLCVIDLHDNDQKNFKKKETYLLRTNRVRAVTYLIPCRVVS